MGTMRDHDAGWTRLRVVYVRARRYYFVNSSRTLIQILFVKQKSNFLSQTILSRIFFFFFKDIYALLIIYFIVFYIFCTITNVLKKRK